MCLEGESCVELTPHILPPLPPDDVLGVMSNLAQVFDGAWGTHTLVPDGQLSVSAV